MQEQHVTPTAEGETPAVVKTKSVSKPGKGARQKQELQFRQKQNRKTVEALRASIYARMMCPDPTSLATIKLVSNVIPSRVPVSLRVIPSLINNLWARMEAIGTRPFSQFAQSQRHKAVFFKVCLLILEAKVSWAQRKVENAPRFDLPTQFKYSDMTLRKITAVSKKLPFPMAIAVESLGNFTIDGQQVVPVFARTTPDIASGAVNFALSDVIAMCRTLASPHQPDNALVEAARAIRALPLIDWVVNQDGTTNLSAQSAAFWARPANADPLPEDERTIFLQIVASMESKRSFLLSNNIETGDGSAVPVVRFHEPFDPDETETLYYSNVQVSQYEEQLALALMYGYEYQIEPFSRFCGSYDEPLIHGSSSQAEARSALIWADKQ